MVEIKPMPYAEKYVRVLGDAKRDDYVVEFVEQHLGRGVAEEYVKRRDAVIQPIPADANDEVKYEIAYKNWIAGASVAFGFVREKLGQQGIDEMAEAGAESLVRANANPALFMLALVRAFSPGKAFEMVAKKSAYELQWLTDYSVEELNRRKLVIDVPRCKILDYPDTEDVCLIGCQREYPRWLARQLHVNMEAERRGNSCALKFTPLQ